LIVPDVAEIVFAEYECNLGCFFFFFFGFWFCESNIGDEHLHHIKGGLFSTIGWVWDDELVARQPCQDELGNLEERG